MVFNQRRLVREILTRRRSIFITINKFTFNRVKCANPWPSALENVSFFLINDNCIVTSFAGLFSFITIFSLVIFGPRSVSASKSESSLSFKAAWKNWIALVVKDSGSRWFNKAGVLLTFSFKGFQTQVLLDNFTLKIFPGQVLPDKLSSKRFAKQVFPQEIS